MTEKRHKSAISKFTDFCLWLFTEEHIRETIMEDLEDGYFGNRERRGPILAGMIWLGKLLIIMMTFGLKSAFWRGVMFRNYLKITLRNFKRNRGFSVINISGLVFGFTLFLLIQIQFDSPRLIVICNLLLLYRIFQHPGVLFPYIQGNGQFLFNCFQQIIQCIILYWFIP